MVGSRYARRGGHDAVRRERRARHVQHRRPARVGRWRRRRWAAGSRSAAAASAIVGLILYFLLSAARRWRQLRRRRRAASPTRAGGQSRADRPSTHPPRHRLPHRRAGEPAARLRGRRRRQLARQLLDRHVRPLRPDLHARRAPTSSTAASTPAAAAPPPDTGPFYCPADNERLHRPDLLQGAGARFGAQGGNLLPRLRHRARVRPPRPVPARHHRPRAGGRHRPDLGLGAPRAAGRLLRRRLGQPRRQRCRRRRASR